jgi:acyl carrier protein
VPGELYIGGESLARGYHQRPELTAEKFVSNPFSHQEGDRIYKTGDLVCYRADGVLEFLGRVDDQVKIRGFRIELGEIEAVLLSHPEVRKAAVLTWEDATGENRLVAYIVTEEPEIAAPKLRSWMKAKLPEYMVPTAFVRLDSLPITPNGKVDRGVLPPPPAFDLATHFVAPRSKTEIELCALWQGILKRCKVGIRDNFFELGGHSLLAMRVTARCSEMFRVTLPLASVFEYPTIEQLASLIDRIRAHRDQEVKPAIVPRSREAFRTKERWSSKAVSDASD